MADIYVRLLNTPQFTLVVGELKEELQISKGMLALHSDHFGKTMNKQSAEEENEGKIILEGVGAAAVKEFVRWCCSRRLEFLPTANLDELRQRKVLLIDLTIFSDMYGIPKLQNEATSALARLFAFEPTLLTKIDVEVVFARMPFKTPLRDLVMLVLVVQLEQDDSTTTVEDYEDINHNHKDFLSILTKWYKKWLQFGPHYDAVYGTDSKVKGPKQKKVKKPSRLSVLLEEKEMVDAFKVEQIEPAEWILEMVGKRPKPAVVPIQPGEVIELD